MAVDVSAFTALAKSEFQDALIALQENAFPAEYKNLIMEMKSTVKVETHSFMSNIPRLQEFLGTSQGSRLQSSGWTVPNKTYRAGPVRVLKDDLDDDQTGGYLKSINMLPGQAQKDIGHRCLTTLAAGTSNLCFDGTAMFADSHTIGSGDNLMTANNSGNDGVTHYIIAVITDNPIKPLIFQDREPLSGLETDADTAQAKEAREFKYWADTRFGIACAGWQVAIHMTITDTPTLSELSGHIRDIINRFRTFTLPKGSDVDDALYMHENWKPSKTGLTLLCNMGLGELLDVIANHEMIAAGTSGATVSNQYNGKFTVVPTGALGA